MPAFFGFGTYLEHAVICRAANFNSAINHANEQFRAVLPNGTRPNSVILTLGKLLISPRRKVTWDEKIYVIAKFISLALGGVIPAGFGLFAGVRSLEGKRS